LAGNSLEEGISRSRPKQSELLLAGFQIIAILLKPIGYGEGMSAWRIKVYITVGVVCPVRAADENGRSQYVNYGR
jgi:hypothetical protein